MWIRGGPGQRNILLRRKFLNLLNKIQRDKAVSQVCDLSEFESVKNDLLNEEFWGASVHGETTTGSLTQLIEALSECCVFAYQHLHQQQQQQQKKKHRADSMLKKSLTRCVPPPHLRFQERMESKLGQIVDELQLSQGTAKEKFQLSQVVAKEELRLSPEEDDQNGFRGSWSESIFFQFSEFWNTMMAFPHEKPEDPLVRAIAIVGMGGSGKTAIAREAYCYHKTVSDARSCFTWLSLSSSEETTIDQEETLEKALLRDMMNQIMPDQADDVQSSNEVASMMTRIRKELTGKNYVIVIDDLMEDTPPRLFSWFVDLASSEVRQGETFGDRLAHALPNGTGSSWGRIIVTSRMEDELVVKVVGSDKTFRLDAPLLSDEGCWQIIEKQLGGDEGALSNAQQQKDVIIDTCGGLPLAAVAFAHALRALPSHTDHNGKGEGPSK